MRTVDPQLSGKVLLFEKTTGISQKIKNKKTRKCELIKYSKNYSSSCATETDVALIRQNPRQTYEGWSLNMNLENV